MKYRFTYCLMVLFMFFAATSFAQQDITIQGKVVDSLDGKGIPGVSVLIKGTTKGTQTDAEGNYRIAAPSNATLTFSFISYTRQEKPVSGQAIINVTLASANEQLDQVVVVGYGTQRKIDVTGSVAVVKGEDISKQASVNAMGALQGKVAGVQITNAGKPGTSPQVRIRGLGTAYGSGNPLYVVDGVWLNDINFLNPADIENMSVLKDASSKAIYGVRAANGVVLVTTKKGKGKTTISYTGDVRMEKVTNLVKMANGTEYANLINEQNIYSGGGAVFENTESFGVGTKWYDQVLRDAITTNHYLSISGSTEKSNYSFSGGYLKQQGIVKGNDFSRITGRLQNEIQATGYLKVGYNAILEHNKGNDSPADIIYKSFTAAPIVPVFNADGSYGDPQTFPIGNATNNPRAQLDFFDQITKSYKVTGNVFAEIKFLKDFTFKTSFGGEFTQAEGRNYTPVYRATTGQFNTNSLLELTRSETRNWIFENTLTYSKRFDKHNITALVGQTAQRNQFNYIRASAQNVPRNSDADLYLGLGDNTAQFPRSVDDLVAGNTPYLDTYASYFGRVNYSFDDRYNLTAMLRADGSSKFVDDQRWGYFPSIGLGWNITNESFMKDQNIFNTLRLKGSWGKTGNASVPPNLATLTVTRSPQYIAVFGNGNTYPGANFDTAVSDIIYWERGAESNIGIEGASLNNHLNYEIEVYRKVTEQGIFAIPQLGSIGLTGNVIANQADFQNQGIEVAVGWQDETAGGFKYSINGNFSYNANKVKEVATGNVPIYGGGSAATGGQLSTRTIVGQPIGSFFGLQVDGIFQNEAEIESSSQPNAAPGDFRYVDTNNDGTIDARDRVVLGNPNPKYFYGLNTNFAYKNFDLTVDIQGVAGVQIYNANKGLRFGSENFSKDFYDNRWHGEGTSNTYPSANIGGNQNYWPNSWFVEDGSYLRIRNLQLGYTFPEATLSKLNISRLRVFVNAQNAFNFFNYTGFSPEIIGTAATGSSPIEAGIDNGVYPLSAVYSFGVNLTF